MDDIELLNFVIFMLIFGILLVLLCIGYYKIKRRITVRRMHNRTPNVELPPGNRKAFFFKLLGFDKYELYQDYAKAELAKLSREIEIKTGQRKDPDELLHDKNATN